MELVYIWVRDYHPFKETGFDFSSKFTFDSAYSQEYNVLNIAIRENVGFIENFYGDNILNLSTIVGSNGAGKTRLLELIARIKSKELWYDLEDYVAVEYNAASKSFQVHTNMYNIISEPLLRQIRRGEKRLTVNLNFDKEIFNENDFASLRYQTIYYKPHVHFDYSIGHEPKSHLINISTDFLLTNDIGEKDMETIPSHKLANVKRQFEFVSTFNESNHLSTSLPIPNKVLLKFSEYTEQGLWRHQLDSSAQEIRKYFLGNSDPYIAGRIMDEINVVVDTIYVEERLDDKNEEKLKDLYLERIRLFILGSCLHHFFSNMNTDNQWYEEDIEVKVADIEELDLWSSSILFANQQSWTLRQADNVSPFGLYLDALNNFISSDNIELINDRNYYSFLTTDFDSVIELLKLQISYFESLRNYRKANSIPPNLSIDWRNMSSGEKSMLDLFSRLNYAKDLVSINDSDDSTQDDELTTELIYLILDEGDAGFHPEWQRLYIKTILDFLPLIFRDNKFQIILSSHSPFQLTDMIGHNVVSLKKLEDGSVMATNDFKTEKLYSANIHSLLAHNFFMENGVTGEFARCKNQEVINWVTSDGVVEESEGVRFKKIINLINDTVLKKKLLLLYNKKVGKNSEIERLSVLRDEIENKIKELKESGND